MKFLSASTSTPARSVAPFAGAWIEIKYCRIDKQIARSLPSRERGLKSVSRAAATVVTPVAPFAGAWIEITISFIVLVAEMVAPFAGAWIEIASLSFNCCVSLCRSLRGSVD